MQVEKFYIKKKIKLLWRAYLFAHNRTMSLTFNVYWSMKKVSAILKFLPNAHVWKVCGEFLIWQPPVINKSFIPFHKRNLIKKYFIDSHDFITISPGVKMPTITTWISNLRYNNNFVYILLPIHTIKVTDNRLLRKFQNVY